MDAERAATSFGSAWTAMARAAAPPMWHRAEPGAVAMVTELPVPTLNGVWVLDGGADDDTISGLLDDTGTRSETHCLQGRPQDSDRLARIADARGMTAAGDIPIMVRDLEGLGRPRSDLRIRRVGDDELVVHADLAARGFGGPKDIFVALITRLGGYAPLHVFVGDADGDDVCTAVGVHGDDGSVAVFNVATPPEHQGQGFGAAITAAVLADAHDSGATWAWLQSSPAGYPVYRRMGFQELEAWPTWISA